MAKILTEAQFPYTGPYGLAKGPIPKSKGNTPIALKRAMSRLGLLEWTDFDKHYNRPLEEAMDKWDAGKDGYGPGRWAKIRAAIVPKGLPHEGEFALDKYARTIVQDEAGLVSDSSDMELFQTRLSEFCHIAEHHAGNWRYDQDRPFRVDVSPDRPVKSDCSGSVVQAAFWASKMSGVKVADPSKQGWSGFGNTDQFEDDWTKVGAPYRVGDLGHFHSERHVILCITPGNQRTAMWWSFGSEPPRIFRLIDYNRFPAEFMFVVRPEYIDLGL